MSGSKWAEFLYKKTHVNHPSSIWTRSSKANYKWLLKLFMCLSGEYTLRYGKIHNTVKNYQMYLTFIPDLPDLPFTQPLQAMPEKYMRDDSVEAYRLYYMGDKFPKSWFQFKHGLPKSWEKVVDTYKKIC